MTDRTATDDDAASNIKARVNRPGSHWRPAKVHVETISAGYRRPRRIVLRFGDRTSIELRTNQAVNLINAIADALERRA